MLIEPNSSSDTYGRLQKIQRKRIFSSHPRYADARWWIYKRLKGKTIHQSIPEAKTKQEAELAERQIIKASFDHNYNVADTTTTLAAFIEKKYRPYVEQNNVNKGAKDLYTTVYAQTDAELMLEAVKRLDKAEEETAQERATTQ